MNPLSEPARAYLRAVRRQLDVPKKDRKRLVKRLSEALSAYLEENPDASPQDLAAALGSPDQCAAELLSEFDPAQVAAVRRRKKALLYGVIAVLAALSVLLFCFAKYLFDNGGIVTIEIGHYDSIEDMPPPPEEGTATVRYHYDD